MGGHHQAKLVESMQLQPNQAVDRIDPDSPVDLHYQLRQILRQQIESGLYRPGDPFPTSRELRERYGVSSTTVERALGWLAEHGLIHRKPGRGTIVSAPSVTSDLSQLSGVIEEIEALGLECKTRILRAERFQPTDRQSEFLGLVRGELAFRLDRLRTVGDEEPVTVELGIYPPDIGERLLAEPHLMAGPLYRIMEVEFGLQLEKASQTMGAAVAKARESGLLRVPVGAPLVYFDRVVYLTNGRPVQFARCYFPASRYSFHVWLRRSDPDPSLGLNSARGRISALADDSWDQ